jgi:hypothetical protein
MSDSVEFLVDTSSVEKMLGAGYALTDAANDKIYLDSVVRAAFGESEVEFNREAAAYAATGAIRHMYEWGTVGINIGRSNMRPNPASARARLWSTHLSGRGLNQTYSFEFKPSLAFVPKPTARETGMSQDVISKMKDHIFWNKAQVYEFGQHVVIARKAGTKYLLIPQFKDNYSPYARPNDIKRGYTLTRAPLTVQPGKQVMGNFTNFWSGWWESQGQGIVDARMKEMVTEHFLTDIEVNTGGPMHPPSVLGSKSNIEKERARVAKNARARALYAKKKAQEANQL